MVDLRARGRARALGAEDQARRLGCSVVGTEHLLIASLGEASVRWVFRTAGVELSEIQTEVARVTAKRRARSCAAGITADAADAVMPASADSEVLDTDRPGSADIARVRRALAVRFLSRTKQSDARVILDGLGLIKCRARVLATIEHNARRAEPSSSTDRPAGPDADDRAGRETCTPVGPRPGPESGPTAGWRPRPVAVASAVTRSLRGVGRWARMRRCASST